VQRCIIIVGLSLKAVVTESMIAASRLRRMQREVGLGMWRSVGVEEGGAGVKESGRPREREGANARD
jgi:hypothetical protein